MEEDSDDWLKHKFIKWPVDKYSQNLLIIIAYS